MFDRSVSRLLAVIPARGGSKRIPKKNVRHFHGRPIIAYTIEAAIKSELFDRVIVSTDCDEIAKISIACGADVPFLRDPILADDHTPVSAVTVDTINILDPDGKDFSSVAQLMPNCPLRTSEDIQASYQEFVRTSSESQISIARFGWQNPWWAMKLNDRLQLEPIFENSVTQRSQDLPEVFFPTGAIWWGDVATLRREKTFHIEGRTGWEMPWNRAVDIDTEDDWAFADVLMSNSLNFV